MNLSDVKSKTSKELVELARDFDIDDAGEFRRQELIFAILRAQSQQRGVITAEGVLEILPDGFGFLRAPDANYLPGADDIYVSPSQIRRFNLRTGDTVTGQIRAPKESERYFALLKVEQINHAAPDSHRDKVPFDELTPVHPSDRMTLGPVIDLLCPIGKGQRALVVAQPRAGRTTLLVEMAGAIATHHPECELLVLLIDERPEEVTEMKRATSAQVVSSTFDESAARHVQVAEIVVEKARRLAETGEDIVILLDSITRLARAYNQTQPPSGNTLPGGVDAAALHAPKRFFGAARNLEEGGSVTIIATALEETGSEMDAFILEELIDAANCEIHLSRSMADRRVFPSIDLCRSRTRRDDQLLPPADLERATALRDKLRGLDPIDALGLVSGELELG